MASSEGRYEIEAAKLRLAAAKTQVSSAQQLVSSTREMYNNAKRTLDNAKKAMDTVTKTNNMAKSQLSASTNEMKEAQSRLTEAEKRWEVIEIDDLGSPKKDDDITKNKKRKVSVSPPSRESNNNNDIGTYVLAAARAGGIRPAAGGGNNRNRTVTAGQSNSVRRASTSLSSPSSSNNNRFDQIIVEGCGNTHVNGTYNRSHVGATVYIKLGGLAGARAFAIFQVGESYWNIGTWNVNNNTSHLVHYTTRPDYTSPPNNALVPPENGWIVVSHFGVLPAPTCRVENSGSRPRQQIEAEVQRRLEARSSTRNNGAQTKTIIIDSCGVSEVNGTYSRNINPSTHEGSPIYKKFGTYNNESITFGIFCKKHGSNNNTYWHIGVLGKMTCFYRSSRAVGAGPNAGSVALPPMDSNEWVCIRNEGKMPLPQLELECMSPTV